jgi:hypothetical protein
MPPTRVLGVRFTPDEREIIETAAAATGQTAVSYVRAAALEKATTTPAVVTPPRRQRPVEPRPPTAPPRPIGIPPTGSLNRATVEPRPKGGKR